MRKQWTSKYFRIIKKPLFPPDKRVENEFGKKSTLSFQVYLLFNLVYLYDLNKV